MCIGDCIMPYPVVVIRNVQSNLVLDASEYQVKLQEHTGFPAQLWSMEPTGSGAYFFVNNGNELVLDIESGAEERNHIITFKNLGGQNQQWIVNPDKTISSVANTNLVLDVSGSDYSPGGDIIAFRRHGGSNQIFQLEYQYPIVCIMFPDSNLVLDASEPRVTLQEYNGTPMQLWTMEPADDGAYFFANCGNGLVMDIENRAEDKKHIITLNKHGGLDQQWVITPDQAIVNVADANLAVDICEENYTPGNIIIAYEKHGGPNQIFQLQQQQSGANF